MVCNLFIYSSLLLSIIILLSLFSDMAKLGIAIGVLLGVCMTIILGIIAVAVCYHLSNRNDKQDQTDGGSAKSKL